MRESRREDSEVRRRWIVGTREEAERRGCKGWGGLRDMLAVLLVVMNEE